MTRNEDRPINILAVVTSTGMVPIPELHWYWNKVRTVLRVLTYYPPLPGSLRAGYYQPLCHSEVNKMYFVHCQLAGAASSNILMVQ
jgi:hypothetical protein